MLERTIRINPFVLTQSNLFETLVLTSIKCFKLNEIETNKNITHFLIKIINIKYYFQKETLSEGDKNLVTSVIKYFFNLFLDFRQGKSSNWKYFIKRVSKMFNYWT